MSRAEGLFLGGVAGVLLCVPLAGSRYLVDLTTGDNARTRA